MKFEKTDKLTINGLPIYKCQNTGRLCIKPFDDYFDIEEEYPEGTTMLFVESSSDFFGHSIKLYKAFSSNWKPERLEERISQIQVSLRNLRRGLIKFHIVKI